MIINQGVDIIVQKDPVSFIAGIQVVNGTLTQQYDKDNKVYSPDRSVVPLVLKPVVRIVDVNGDNNNTLATISSVTWYYLLNGVRTELPNTNINPKFVRSNNTLTVKVNTSTDLDNAGVASSVAAPSEIIAGITFTNPNTGDETTCMKSVQLSTSYTSSHKYTVALDMPSMRKIDPIRMTRQSATKIEHTIRATLYDNSIAVRNTGITIDTDYERHGNVAYYWMYNTGGDWKKVDATCFWLLTKLDTDGNLGEDMKVNLDAIDEMKIRCYAVEYNNARPQTPTNKNQFAETTLKRSVSNQITGQVVADKGTYFTDTESEVEAHLEIFDHFGRIPNIDNHYKVQWKGISHRTNKETDEPLATGYSVKAKVSKIGVSDNYGATLMPEVYEKGALQLVADQVSGQSYTTAETITTPNGTYSVSRKLTKV